MGSLDFYVEINLEVEDPNGELVAEADRRLRALDEGHTDLAGSSVAIEKLVKGESPYWYQARIVVYQRPAYVSVTKKGPDAMTALKDALDALERKVRDVRATHSEAQRRAPSDVDNVIHGLTPKEIMATYFDDPDPAQLIERGRTDLAGHLMANHGLSQEAAYFAADKILRAADEQQSSNPASP